MLKKNCYVYCRSNINSIKTERFDGEYENFDEKSIL